MLLIEFLVNHINCEGLQRHILIRASSDRRDLPAMFRIINRTHFPLRIIGSLLILRHTQTSHVLES